MLRLILLTLGFLVIGAGLGMLIVWIQYFAADEPFIKEFYERYEFVEPTDPSSDSSTGPMVKLPDGDTFEFGSIETSKSYSHNFEVHNEGDSPLIIELASTTCKCTSADIEIGKSVEIKPGQKYAVTLSWFATHFQQKFKQSATFKTNDENQPEIQLVVTGNVTRAIEPVPHEAIISSLAADGDYTTQFDIVSFKHDEFKLNGHRYGKPELADAFDFSFVQLTNEQLAEHKNAKSGYRCTVTKVAAIPIGPFSQKIYVDTDVEGFEAIEFTLKGTSVGNISIINQSKFTMVDERNEIRVGLVNKGQTIEVKFILLIRGDQDELNAGEFSTSNDPDEYLTVEIGEPRLGENLMRVPVTVKIGGDVAPIVRMGPDVANMGKVQIKTPITSTPLVDVYFSFSVSN